MKPALLLIDLQKAWYQSTTWESMDRATSLLLGLKNDFDRMKWPVYFIQHENSQQGIVAGTEGFEWISPIQPDPHLCFTKRYGNAFNQTNLYEQVQKDGVDTLIIGGYRAENCILSTYRGALDLDLVPILLRGAIAGPIQERIDFVEAMSECVSPLALRKLLEII